MNEHYSALHQAARDRFGHINTVSQRFFTAEATQIAEACLAMARRFDGGGRLLAFGAGNAVTDAQHVSVEFIHPVIVGKRALPAIPLGTDVAATAGMVGTMGWPDVYVTQLNTLGRPEDIALGIDPTGADEAVWAGLAAAARQGLLTVGLTAGREPELDELALDFCFIVPDNDLAVIQEVHETLYHVLWELVHVFLVGSG